MMVFFLACTLSRSDIRSKDSLWISARYERSKNIKERQLLLDELAVRKDEMMLPILCAQTESTDQDLSHGAIDALNRYDGKIGGRDDTYISLLSSQDEYMRRMALEGIIKRFQTLGEIPYLFNALSRIVQTSADWQVRLYAIQALTWTSNSGALLQQTAQHDDNDTIRAQAVVALGIQKYKPSYNLLYRLSQQDSSKLVREEAQKTLQKVDYDRVKHVIAVMPFEITEGHEELEQGFRSYLSGRLGASNIATVVERGQVQTVVDELIYQDNFINDGKAVEIGKALRAEQVITGSIQVLHGQIVITIKRIDVQTQEIVSSSQSSGSFIDFDQIQRVAATTFIKAF